MAAAGLIANRIESLLSARLFLEPQLVGGRLVFVSNLGGHLSLYAMDADGGVPEPLLPPTIALQNPELIGGYAFHPVPHLERIIVMIDRDGDENYEPFLVPAEGGFPEPLGDEFSGRRSHLLEFDSKRDVAYFAAESREESLITAIRVDLTSGDVEILGESPYGAFPVAWTPDHSRVVLADSYTIGDVVLYEPGADGARRMLYGTPLEEREEDDYPLSGIRSVHCTSSARGLALVSTLFDDAGSAGYLDLERPGDVEPVAIDGLRHQGEGELESLRHLENDRYALLYNIDGCSWAYEAHLDEAARRLTAERVLVGEGELAGGMLHGLHYDEESDRFALSFCTATLPTQLYVLDDEARPAALRELKRVTRRAVLVNELERTWPHLIGAKLLSWTLWRRHRLTRHDAPVSVRRGFTRSELLDCARNAGFNVARVRRFFFYRLVLIADVSEPAPAVTSIGGRRHGAVTRSSATEPPAR